MKIMITALIILLSACAAYEPVPPEALVIRTEAVLPEMTKGEIFDRSKLWIERHLYAKDNIIEVADREEGLIVARGTIDYPAADRLQAIEKVQYKVSFTMREEIRDAGITLIFTDLLLDVPPRYVRSRFWGYEEKFIPGHSVQIRKRENLEAARRGVLDIAGRLAEHLKNDKGKEMPQ